MLAAGNRFGVNHASVARRVDALETGLQARLFLRRPSGFARTDAGEGWTLADIKAWTKNPSSLTLDPHQPVPEPNIRG